MSVPTSEFGLMLFNQEALQRRSCALRLLITSIIVLLSLNQASCFGSLFESATEADNVTLTSISAPLPEGAFKAIISLPYPVPTKLRPGQQEAIHCVVKNASNSLWPAAGRSDGKFQITLGNRWLDLNHKMIVADDGRSALPYNLQPGAEAELLLTITAPSEPGDYILELGLVQEQVIWFVQKGSEKLQVRLTVGDRAP